MKLFDIIKSASSNLWRNKGRTVLTVIAIFIGAFTISLTTGVNKKSNLFIFCQPTTFNEMMEKNIFYLL